MKILGILVLTDKGEFNLYPLRGMSITESPKAVPDASGGATGDSGVITPPTPEAKSISEEVVPPRNVSEVLAKHKNR